MTHSIFNEDSSTELVLSNSLDNKISISIKNYDVDAILTHQLSDSDMKDLVKILSYLYSTQAIITQNQLTKTCQEIRQRPDGHTF